jgi:hypothetical protein
MSKRKRLEWVLVRSGCSCGGSVLEAPLGPLFLLGSVSMSCVGYGSDGGCERESGGGSREGAGRLSSVGFCDTWHLRRSRGRGGLILPNELVDLFVPPFVSHTSARRGKHLLGLALPVVRLLALGFRYLSHVGAYVFFLSSFLRARLSLGVPSSFPRSGFDSSLSGDFSVRWLAFELRLGQACLGEEGAFPGEDMSRLASLPVHLFHPFSLLLWSAGVSGELWVVCRSLKGFLGSMEGSLSAGSGRGGLGGGSSAR